VGVVQFGLGAFVSSIALSYHDGTIFPIGISVCLISCLAFLVIRTYKNV
jgi:DHA1 family bicyclomycin/chloramphenicol resistance-like MFS transporter